MLRAISENMRLRRSVFRAKLCFMIRKLVFLQRDSRGRSSIRSGDTRIEPNKTEFQGKSMKPKQPDRQISLKFSIFFSGISLMLRAISENMILRQSVFCTKLCFMDGKLVFLQRDLRGMSSIRSGDTRIEPHKTESSTEIKENP